MFSKNFMPFAKFSAILVRYGIALVATGVALYVTTEVDILQSRYTFLLPLAAALFSAWFGGAGPGIVSIAVSALFISYDLMLPAASFAIEQPIDIAGLVAFMVVGLFMVSLAATRTRALERLSEVNVFLDQRVRQRTQELEAAFEKLKGSEEDLRKANQALQRHAEELVRTNIELERFMYISSHDLKEPLRMITSYLKLLARRYQNKLDSDADEFIGYALEGAERMDQLVRDVLDYARLGERSKKLAKVDCNEVLDYCLSSLQISIEESAAVVTKDTLPTLIADRTQLGQLFQNLIANGIKFRTKEPPRVHVSAVRKAEGIVFSVRDNGIGIESQYLDRIFLIFQRLHSRGEYPGTGIGLAICKKIVEGHGGRIWADSQPGKGSTFYFTLPADSSV